MTPIHTDAIHSSTENPGQPLAADYEELCQRLAEAEATLEAIRSGKVDAVVVAGQHGHQVYTLKSADEPYRILIEQMQEAALTLNDAGAILFCNQFFSSLVGYPHSQVIGRFLTDFLATSDRHWLAELLRAALAGPLAWQRS